MLKRKDSRKEFIVIENKQKRSSSIAWSTFGFPARLTEDNTYERLHGYASCFQCKSTYTFQSDGSDSTKHLLRHVCPKIQLTSEHDHEGPLDKLLKSKKLTQVTINSKDSTRIKNELTKWICQSVRPFNIVEDVGLRNVLQTVLDIDESKLICLLNHELLFHLAKVSHLNAVDLLVTPTTISNNVRQLADDYRSQLRSILIEQAASGCLCLCPDLWADKCRKVNYLGLTAIFINKKYELISVDLCCTEYEEADKSGDCVLQVSKVTESQSGECQI